MTEKWLNVPGTDGMYQVSDNGRVRSMYKWRGRCGEWAILKLKASTRNGVQRYNYVCLSVAGKKKTRLVHRLVAGSFIGSGNGAPVNHKNGIKTDNRVSNLEYTTPEKNTRHARENGMMTVGVKCYNSKLTESQVFRIKMINNVGVERGYWAKLCRSLGVNYSTIYSIIKNKSWKHIEV